MGQRRIPWQQRARDWAGDRVARMMWAAGRRRFEPQRESDAYARLFNIGGWQLSDKRPLIKPTPANLRKFGKTPYARRAIRRIKDPIGNMEWAIGPKPNVKLNSELQRQIDIATECLQRPNHDDSFRSFVEQLVEDMMHVGAGSYEHQIGGDNVRPFWAWPVDAMSIQINAAWNGQDSEARYYQTRGYGNIGGVQGTPLRNDELVYIRMEPTTENPFGLGPLEVAFGAINRKLGVEDYSGKMASNAQPENMLFLPGAPPEFIATVRDWWRNEVEGQGQTPILGSPSDATKAEVHRLRATDDKALFIGYQELLIREIATSFCISPLSLGVQNDVNRNTAEVVDDMDWDNAVVPVATLIAAYITHESINARLGFSQLQFNFLGLKRDDKQAEAEIFKLEYQNNATTPNEYRARNRQPPMDSEWGDLTYADAQIAMQAARGTGEIADPDLPAPRPSSAKGKGKPKEK
jgi:phage portal protein BeeE